MSQLAPKLAILLCCATTAVRADEPRPKPATASPSSHKAAKAALHRSKAKTVPTQAARAAVEPILGRGTDAPTKTEIAGSTRTTGGDAWSVSPRWTASNGGSSAAYGTRALINELQSNPAETTGYGAGAQVDFHF